jgi:hypothetical protein
VARKTIYVSDLTGKEIDEKDAATSPFGTETHGADRSTWT